MIIVDLLNFLIHVTFLNFNQRIVVHEGFKEVNI